ncbi:MAG: YdcF family protein [Armatimonadetes bacterium]|nr:YdcF family protein [Armatimonadota bacterium]
MTRRKKRILIWSFAGAGLPFLWCVGVAIGVETAGAPNPSAKGDAAIVLGAAVWDDRPSPVFAARIDHALDLYRRGQVTRMIFTGGLGEGDVVSEGEAARRYAISKGIPGDSILVESQSRSTVANLAGAQRLMDSAGLRSAVIVSDPYHLRRAGMIARRLDLRHVCSPTETSRYTGFFAKGRQLSRETYYITKLLVTGN